MKKILHLQPELNLTCGITSSISLLVKNIGGDFKNYIFTFGGDGFDRFTDIDCKIFVIKKPQFFINRLINNFSTIYRFCKREKIDTIHSHHRYFDFVAYLVSKVINLKTIMSVHSMVNGTRLFSYWADNLTACSDFIKQHLIKEFGIKESKISVINNFVNPNEIQITRSEPDIMNELGIDNSLFLVGFVGRFDIKEKGIDVLLKAFHECLKLDKKLFLLMIGSGKDSGYIYDYVKINKIPCKILTPRLDIYNYYNVMDIVILPSIEDPFPLTVLEAGSMKKPFIGSKSGGIKEIIRDKYDGLLFETNDYNKLANYILLLKNNETMREDLSANLYNKVAAYYNSERVIDIYKKLYLS